jgi:hypothetical protein
MRRRPVIWTLVGVVAAAAAFGLYWFAPWKLFTSTTVNDVLPSVAFESLPPTSATGSPTPTDQVLVRGTFISHEHDTSGEAQLVRLADGRQQLLLVGLDTSDGPDLRVWLTDQPVTDSWYNFDDGRYLEVGELKGNKGNQVYEIPPGTDLSAYRSVTIWCKRFSVSFGAAELS